jgi:Raf kinase inhibitor-like YbhB/YbcL family protein
VRRAPDGRTVYAQGVRRALAVCVVSAALLAAGCGDDGASEVTTPVPAPAPTEPAAPPEPAPPPEPPPPATGISFTSPAFEQGGSVPARNTCDGEDLSPPLEWSGLPDGAVEVVVIAADRDRNNLTHWLAYGIPAAAGGLPEGVAASPEVQAPVALRQGENDLDRVGWSGPCPPSGEEHTYVFLFFALSGPIAIEGGADRNAVEEALAPLVIGNAALEVRYRRAG